MRREEEKNQQHLLVAKDNRHSANHPVSGPKIKSTFHELTSLESFVQVPAKTP